MRLLLLGGAPFTKGIIQKLIGRARHSLDWRSNVEPDTLDVASYDMMLVDGFPGACKDREAVSEILQAIRHKAPEMPIIILSYVNGQGATEGCGASAGHSCGIVKSADGVKLVRCRLKELAFSEAEVALTDVIARLPMEPITFEYQGYNADHYPN